jgi:hypothetical protein
MRRPEADQRYLWGITFVAREKVMRADEINNLLETNPWWKEISDELDRRFMLQQVKEAVPNTLKVEAVNALREHTFITEDKLSSANSDPVFIEARALLAGLSPEDPFPDRITELYKTKKPDSLDRIKRTALALISLLPNESVRERVQRWWTSDRSELELSDLDNTSKELHLSGSTQRYILRSLLELICVEEVIRDDRTSPFSSKMYIPASIRRSSQGGNKVTTEAGVERINYLAYRVFDPLWDGWMERFEPEYVDFPLKWAGGVFNIHQTMNLYMQHKLGGDLMQLILSLYRDSNRLSRLQNAIASCPITSSYKELFEEIIENFQHSRFKVCAVSLLPMVEGVLWEFAWWWNDVNGGLFDRPISRRQYKCRTGFELIRMDGERVGGRPNIGSLLRKTKFGDVIYIDFVEYLVEELFDERSPVLHGRDPKYGNDKKAANLLLAIEIIERAITNATKDKLGADLLKLTANDGSTMGKTF